MYGMKKSDGAEQPTTGHLKRAGLGRITLWKSYAKRMLRWSEFAYATGHTWLHGIQHAHILHGLGDRLAGKLRLRLCRQGLKRLDQKRRGRTIKTAATIGLPSELVNGSGMDYTKWDDTVLATAALFGSYKLRRSGEFLRKNGVHLANKDTCVLVGVTRLLKDGVELAWNDPRALEADELLANRHVPRGFLSGGDSAPRPVGERVLENLRAGCARYSEGRRRADGRGERDSAVAKAPRRSGVYGMKKSDGAEQPTTGHLMRAGLGRITIWKSYALIRQEKTMIRGATGLAKT